MRIKTLIRILQETDPILPLGIMKFFKPFYRISFVASAASNGLFDILSDGPVPFDRLISIYTQDAEHHEALKAWLQLGIRLNELKFDKKGYSLNGISKRLVSSKNEAWVAVIQEVVDLHHTLILQTPKKLKSGEKWKLEDQDGELIAKSTRTLEPFQLEAIDLTFPSSKPVHLLEIGCGSGFYIKYAANKNPQLSALGLELQSNVAAMARKNIDNWNLQGRVKIKCEDVRSKTPEKKFDIVTLHNNIYYFPEKERIALFVHLRAFLKPGGFLLLTTGCQGGALPLELVNLWAASTDGCGRLPEVNNVLKYLNSAGYADIKSMNLIPGDKYFAFVGYQS